MTTPDTFLLQTLGDIFGISINDADILGDLQQDLTIQTLSVGDTLMAQGAASDALFILLQGRLTASTTTANSMSETFIGEIRRGETIGEVGVIMNAPRGATVRATRTSTVARLSTEALHRLMGKYPALSLAIARTLITRSNGASLSRHPGFVPETICLYATTPEIPLDAIARSLAQDIGPHRIVTGDDNPERAIAAIHEGERLGERVLILADTTNPDWLRLAVSEADEVVRIVEARADPAPDSAETAIERADNALLPRHTLLILHPNDTQSPTGTRNWLGPRKLDRHLHMRQGHDLDGRRVARLLSGRGVGIVFAGGGARGASHLGAIRALSEAGVEFDIVGGTSIGAAMAAWYAMGLRGKALEKAAMSVFVDSGSPTSDWNLLPLLSLVKGRKTRDLGIEAIRAATGHDIDIEDTWIPFFCITANFTAQEQTIQKSGPLWQALTATYAIPGVFPPVVIEGELHVDGGVVNNLPVDVLEDSGAAFTIAVDLLGDKKRTLDIKKMPANTAFLFDKLRPRRRRRYRVPGILSMLLNSTVLSSLKRQREMSLRATLCLRPELPRIGLLDWMKFPEAIEAGYTSTKAQIAATAPEVLAPLQAKTAQ